MNMFVSTPMMYFPKWGLKKTLIHFVKYIYNESPSKKLSRMYVSVNFVVVTFVKSETHKQPGKLHFLYNMYALYTLYALYDIQLGK